MCLLFDAEAAEDKPGDWLAALILAFKISGLPTITKLEFASGFLIDVDDTIFVRFSLFPFRSLRVRVVNGETISRSLEVSTSMLIAERAACERLADLPACVRNMISRAPDSV